MVLFSPANFWEIWSKGDACGDGESIVHGGEFHFLNGIH